MRINLTTPFAEKDAVKALGARWDAAKKVWYITDVADLSPFARWIPDLEGANENSTGAAIPMMKNASKVQGKQSQVPTVRSIIEVPHCGCDVLPWEDCEHTATPPRSATQAS